LNSLVVAHFERALCGKEQKPLKAFMLAARRFLENKETVNYKGFCENLINAYKCMGCNTSVIGAPRPIFGGPNLLPTTDVLQTMAHKPQHWDWAQTEITNPIFTLRSVVDYYNKRGSTVIFCMLDISKAFDKVNQ